VRVRAARLLSSLIDRLGERRVERLLGARLALKLLFHAVAGSFDPGAAAGFEGCLVYELTRPATGAPAVVWRIEVTGGQARARRGRCPQPRLTVTVGLTDFLRIGAGALDPAAAVLQGRARFQGPLELAVRLPEMFRVPGGREVTPPSSGG
jgi:hypothetical protein